MSPACWIAVLHGAPDFGQTWAETWWTAADSPSHTSWGTSEWGDPGQTQSMMSTEYGHTWAYSG